MCNDVCLFYPWDNEERDSWSVWDAIFVFIYMLKYRTELCCLGLYSLCVPCVCGWGVCFCVWLYFTVCVDRWVRKPPWYFWRWWKWFVMLADFIRTCQCRFPCKLVLSGGSSSVGCWFDPGCMPKNLGQDTNPCCSLIRLLEYECKCYIEKRLCENEVNKVGFMILQMCLSVYAFWLGERGFHPRETHGGTKDRVCLIGATVWGQFFGKKTI